MKCSYCGKEVPNSPYADYCSYECFSNGFWEDALSNDPIIINGYCYTVGESYGVTKGFEGRTFNIQMNDGREIVTDNLWIRGRLPNKYMRPDNAKFKDKRNHKRAAPIPPLQSLQTIDL